MALSTFNKSSLFFQHLLLMVCCVGGLVATLSAQTNPLSNQRYQLIPHQTGIIPLDSLTILPTAVRIFLAKPDSSENRQVSPALQYSIQNTDLFILQTDSTQQLAYPYLAIHYRVLPFNLGQSFSRFDTSQARINDQSGLLDFSYNPFQAQETILDFGTLDYNGSFTRGLSFGNSQSAVLNANFNLQLSGNLGDDIEILAAITDENIPLQAEGNTQQLQEFDKIFIQLSRQNNQLIAGDYELLRPNSYFTNYYKKLQGATFSNTTELSKGVLSNKASVAVSRGKFARNQFIALEGNQGPYKLRGSEGERFIIALAGTEKVFMDGVLLTRGIDQDYIIDYNRAELTFTNKRLMTKDIRIIVEFEYSDQQYLTSLYALNTAYESEKWQFSFNLFSQQDGRTPIDSISDQQQMALLQAGDNPQQAIVSSVDSLLVFDPLRVLYVRKDTTVQINGSAQTFQILQYSESPAARLTARFSEVGAGNGNYVLSSNQVAASGRIFDWVAPDPFTGEASGNYEPIVQLATPKQQQLYSFNANYQIGEQSKIGSEIALSSNDLNRSSSVGDADNLGLATYTYYQQTLGLGEKGWQLSTDWSHEWVQSRFQALNPYRKAEFVRDWNIENSERRAEHIGRAKLELRKSNVGRWSYELNSFFRDSVYMGWKHSSELQIQSKGWNIDGQVSWLITDALIENSTFFRPRLRIAKTFEKLKDWQLSWYGEREKNDRFGNATDTLSATSFYYDLYRAKLQSPQHPKLNAAVQYSQRYDYQPFASRFKQISVADEINLNGDWNAGRVSRLAWNLTYRNLSVRQERSNLEPQETYLGRIQHILNAWKGALRTNMTYEISSGQEPKIEQNYLRVQPGEGSYIWNDYNQDSIAQISEFEVANYQDQADYVRISIFTDDFIRSNQVQYNQSVNFDAKRIWKKPQKGQKLLSKLSMLLSWRINRKVLDVAGVSPWNPFQLNIVDTALVATTSLIRNVLFFDRNNAVFNVQLGTQNNRQKQVLTAGFESRQQLEYFVNSRWNIGRQMSSQIELQYGNRSNDSERFQNRDFRVDFYTLAPQFTWQPNLQFRSILSYKYLNSSNQIGVETLASNDLSAEFTYNRNTTTSIRLRTSYIAVNFQGDTQSPVAFAMLNGLQNGQNLLWNLSFDRQIGRNIRLSLSYDGRKIGDNQIVHLGRMQVGAVF
ncbi:MAG: hypothetical protein AAF847_01815 [Bacteroidota bacterium]